MARPAADMVQDRPSRAEVRGLSGREHDALRRERATAGASDLAQREPAEAAVHVEVAGEVARDGHRAEPAVEHLCRRPAKCTVTGSKCGPNSPAVEAEPGRVDEEVEQHLLAAAVVPAGSRRRPGW